MTWRIIEARPLTFNDLGLANQTPEELQVTRRVIAKFLGPVGSVDLQLFAVPTLDLIESVIVEAIRYRGLGADTFDYAAWRARGAPEPEIRALYSRLDQARRSEPGFARDKARVEHLEALYAAGVDVDPSIAGPLPFALSSGARAVFMLDGRHRLFAAAAQRPRTLPVYLARPAA